MRWFTQRLNVWGDHEKENQVGCFPTLACYGHREVSSWPAGHWHKLPLCVKTSGITYVLLPDVAPAPALSKWEVLSWCHLPNLVQRTEATWPADQGSVPVSRTVSPFAEPVRLGGAQKSQSLGCVCVFKLRGSPLSLHSSLVMFHSVGDKGALCVLQSAVLTVIHIHEKPSPKPWHCTGWNPKCNLTVVRNDKGWVAGPRGKTVKPKGS